MSDEQFLIETTSDATVMMLPKKGVVLSVKDSKKGPSIPIAKTSSTNNNNGVIAYWGSDNQFPQNVYKEGRANTIVGPTLNKQAMLLYSGGIVWGEVQGYDENNKEKFRILTPEEDPEPYEFLERSNINRYLMQTAKDLYWFNNMFPEFGLSADRTKITWISAQKAMHCRWGVQNPKTGLIDKCFVNPNWAENATADSPETIVLPVLDPCFDPVEQVRQGNAFKYIYELSYPSQDSVYYELADWNAIRESGWLDVAQAIPQFKKSLMKNQMTIKYHVKVSIDWFKWKYSDWDKLTAKQKKQIYKDELQEFNDFLTGSENAGRSILSIFQTDPQSKTRYEGWEIVAVDDKVKDGAYIEDSQEASSHILYALGMPHALIGNTPGKGMGAGSGSDVKEHLNMYLSIIKCHEHLLLEPLQFIKKYNGYRKNGAFRIDRPFMQMLSNITPAKRETV